MEIIVGKNAGFCYGVKRAVEGAEEELQKSDGQIYCLGEIVHNKDVVKDLENKGLKFIENINEANGTTLIRAHGIPKSTYQEAQDKRIQIKDYTCPKVLTIHNIAEEYANKGYFIFLTGSKIHPENIGTISYCGQYFYVLEDEEELNYAIERLEKSGINKLLVISQTTFSAEKFEKIINKIKELIPENIEITIKNTICSATKVRQIETEELSKLVDKMIIIGGKNSSNTKKLFEIAKKYCNNSYCIENDMEIDTSMFNEKDKIGIMAGASTPLESINSVVEKLKKQV